jgi:hypothetical protein
VRLGDGSLTAPGSATGRVSGPAAEMRPSVDVGKIRLVLAPTWDALILRFDSMRTGRFTELPDSLSAKEDP